MAKQKKAAKLSPSSSVKTKSSIVTCPSVSSNIFSALDRIMSGKSWPRSESAEKIFEITEGQVTIEDLYEEWLLYRKRKQNLGRHLRDRSLPRSARMMER